MKRLALALLLAGCASYDRAAISEFQPTADGFEFKAAAGLGYQDGDPKAEATRIAWLEQYLHDNGLCPSGYRLTNRTAVLKREGAIADLKDVYYQGECDAP